jgi:RimJ/RimL family protein N-acetyltransferase
LGETGSGSGGDPDNRDVPLLVDAVVAPGTLSGVSQPMFRLGDLVLRPWRPSDARAVELAYTEPDIQRWHGRSVTEAEAPEWIRSWSERWLSETGAGWAMTGESGVLGQISFRKLSLFDGVAEVSYWVLPPARGRQMACRALCALAAWGFDELGLHRVELYHSTSNQASCRVAEKAGFLLEGTKRDDAFHVDGWHDMHAHGRLADDPRP